MQIKKSRFKKWAHVALSGLMLCALPINKAFSREKETLVPSSEKIGLASWYGEKFHGRKTANGDIFSQKKMTCASNHYPLGTWLRITNTRNGKTVIVQVNDRMHPKMKRVVDLSKAAAIEIGIDKSGVGKVKVEDLGK